MAEITNDLSWSVSREDTFSRCKRAYYYQHYGSWKGWNPPISPEARQAYICKHITSLNPFTGTIAHRSISRIIITRLKMLTRTEGSINAGGYKRIPDVDEDGIREEMDAAFAASSTKLYLEKSPKQFPPFFEDYYGKGLVEDDKESARERVVSAIRCFVESPTYAKLVDIAGTGKGKLTFRHIDGELPSPVSFELDGGVKVWWGPDLAVSYGHWFFSFDWKIAKLPKSSRFQAATYALGARAMWGITADGYVARAVSLDPDVEDEKFSFTEEDLDAQAEYIRRGYAEMEPYHAPGLERDIDSFQPCLGDHCDWCNYQGICE